jgi:hypothetical protein
VRKTTSTQGRTLILDEDFKWRHGRARQPNPFDFTRRADDVVLSNLKE